VFGELAQAHHDVLLVGLAHVFELVHRVISRLLLGGLINHLLCAIGQLLLELLEFLKSLIDGANILDPCIAHRRTWFVLTQSDALPAFRVTAVAFCPGAHVPVVKRRSRADANPGSVAALNLTCVPAH